MTTESPSLDLTTNIWDCENRQTRVELPAGDIHTYTYNSDHKRIAKEDELGVITSFTWDHENIIEESNDTGVIEKERTYKPTQYGDLISQYNVPELEPIYHHYNAQGSTTELTDETEVITDTWTYQSFGKTASRTGTSINPYQWIGKKGYYKDEETNNYSIRRRTYNPTSGRFISEDPIGFKAGDENWYRYVGNDAINKDDPSGLATIIKGEEITSGEYACTPISRQWGIFFKSKFLIGHLYEQLGDDGRGVVRRLNYIAPYKDVLDQTHLDTLEEWEAWFKANGEYVSAREFKVRLSEAENQDDLDITIKHLKNRVAVGWRETKQEACDYGKRYTVGVVRVASPTVDIGVQCYKLSQEPTNSEHYATFGVFGKSGDAARAYKKWCYQAWKKYQQSKSAVPDELKWKPSGPPKPPRAGGTAPEGDFKELFDHLVELRQDGTSIDKVEAVYLDGVQQIQGRASQVGTSVENQFFGTAGSGQWRVYEGNPSLDDAPVIAFNAENGSIAVGRSSGVVDTGTTGYQLFDFSFLYPAE